MASCAKRPSLGEEGPRTGENGAPVPGARSARIDEATKTVEHTCLFVGRETTMEYGPFRAGDVAAGGILRERFGMGGKGHGQYVRPGH